MNNNPYFAQADAVATPRDYLRLARIDHITKQIFILPGIVMAWMLRGAPDETIWLIVLQGVAAAIAIASANYVINEWLDRSSDAYHPEKSQRAAVQKALDGRLVYSLYGLLLIVGLGLAAQVNITVLVLSALFALAGILYNAPPVRTKDHAILDVLSESLNNPLRLAIGWAMIAPGTLPPISLLLGFWFGGAFLMNAKRLAEYRFIVAQSGVGQLHLYRASFRHYSEVRLSIANLIYALLCSFCIAIFVVKYRIEYVLLFPFLTGLFAEYYRLSLLDGSPARSPEKLFLARRLMLLTVVTGIVFMLTSMIELPVLERLTAPHYIDFSGAVME